VSLAIVNRQNTAASLGEVSGRNPGDQRLVVEHRGSSRRFRGWFNSGISGGEGEGGQSKGENEEGICADTERLVFHK